MTDEILISRKEAARRLGMGLTFFEERVQKDLRLVRKGRKRLVLVEDIERWARENAG